jgi:protein-tyrosine-phosphatase
LLKKLRPDLEADSAGLRVAIPIAEEVKNYLARESAEQYLKKVPESLNGKPLREYDVIVAMEQRHKDVIVLRCPECESNVVVWNVEDPYFLEPEYAQKIYDQIKDKVVELAESSRLRRRT